HPRKMRHQQPELSNATKTAPGAVNSTVINGNSTVQESKRKADGKYINILGKSISSGNVATTTKAPEPKPSPYQRRPVVNIKSFPTTSTTPKPDNGATIPASAQMERGLPAFSTCSRIQCTLHSLICTSYHAHT